ncbi:MAG: succinate dehydrogenase cytochrome b subunit [Bacteroidales bacterium]|jgi:succinate dehydrogenase / fumarate reductase cytochrome b subunit|nr:succinate dehydrogenase cytochrome b subunit [Bacteroidales bacterium]MDD3735618.1 succinate dehydrogenase cytochrome b subunit [Bacteroidales bacterium]NLD63452.1 succinate dehydrogenase cytochrome b subunit [Bacteroidales bacterium]HNT92536.1 succinate dehydrogenase cytochrome b subunit [Bacteroidales bacterium]HOO66800.1 succinate dehydrogenase cytochrome b subunit [Bacteroidales bacterium]
MNKILFSAVSKKFVMALAGLFLLLFLPVHLGINLMLLRSDPEPFNNAAHFMATFPLVKVVEILLLLVIVIHIAYGIFLQIQNWLSRPVSYAVRNKSETSAFSKFMIWTGGSVLIFLVIHFFNFYFIKLGLVEGDPENFYAVAYSLFAVPGYVILYWVCFLLLGLHLYHALQSAFQTLGWSNEFWKPVIRVISLIYAIAVPAGFAIIPLAIWLFK